MKSVAFEPQRKRGFVCALLQAGDFTGSHQRPARFRAGDWIGAAIFFGLMIVAFAFV